MKTYPLLRTLFLLLTFVSVSFSSLANAPKRIISLSGAITEVLDGLGVGKQIIAVDLTSDYPAYISQLPKVSKNRSVTIEALSSFRPDLVLALKGELSADIQVQLQKLKIPFVLVTQEFSSGGLQSFIKTIAKAVDQEQNGIALASKLSQDLSNLAKKTKHSSQKILFIYARGAGHMSVAGQNTSIDAVIKEAGFQNAMKGFIGFKTYNTEALVAANPDVILLFSFGISSLGGSEGILKMPGVKLTNAGKNQKIVAMDATLLNNYSLRLPEAIAKLQDLVL
ncbi:hemin ABC transporter substrate-binding protein [Sphingobacterium sp. BN32]|uniref:heme/hemin ABC transporter substrate-binding protein n=1 Tax=Sphingobacterium sp. BN32 TaxID=3058432 RepID=UPI00265CC53F|nr:ABC transporter substrate-binding protein [Sphingobacterium sp. BN32]WKK59459.1 ABC transporter substrate-binding protein [Sphingobacterium sp. BN32]